MDVKLMMMMNEGWQLTFNDFSIFEISCLVTIGDAFNFQDLINIGKLSIRRNIEAMVSVQLQIICSSNRGHSKLPISCRMSSA